MTEEQNAVQQHIRSELSEHVTSYLETLELLTGESVELVDGSHAPGGEWSVWLDDDIIGTGEDAGEAIADAVSTVRLWSRGVK